MTLSQNFRQINFFTKRMVFCSKLNWRKKIAWQQISRSFTLCARCDTVISTSISRNWFHVKMHFLILNLLFSFSKLTYWFIADFTSNVDRCVTVGILEIDVRSIRDQTHHTVQSAVSYHCMKGWIPFEIFGINFTSCFNKCDNDIFRFCPMQGSSAIFDVLQLNQFIIVLIFSCVFLITPLVHKKCHSNLLMWGMTVFLIPSWSFLQRLQIGICNYCQHHKNKKPQ